MRRGPARLHPGGVGDDDFRAVIHPSFGRFPERQLVALDLAGAGNSDQSGSLRFRESCVCVCVCPVTMTFPPPGVWLVLLREPTLA